MSRQGNQISKSRKDILILALSLCLGGLAPFAVLPAAAEYQASNEVIRLNNAGVSALNRQNYQEAIRLLKQAVKADPDYPMARQNLAIAYNNYGLQLQSDPMKALAQFHKAVLLNPNNPTTKQNVSGIIRSMSRDPNKFEDRVDIGDDCRKSSDFAGAIVEYQAALKLKPDAKVWEKLGDVFRVANKLSKAETAYRTSFKMKPDAMCAVKLGQTLQAKKDIAKAIVAYGQALQLNSEDPEVLDALVAGWEAAIAENPVAPANHIGLGQALQLRGDFDQAAEEYKQAIRFSKGRVNPKAQELLTKLPEEMKKAQFEKMVDDGVKYQTAKNYDAAKQCYNEALKQQPNNVKVIVNMGTVFQAEENYAQAIAFYKKALSIQPANKSAQLGLKTASESKKEKDLGQLAKTANEQFKAGDFDKAIASYMQLLKVNPKDAGVHYNLGAAYEEKKDIDAAIAEYRLAASLDKNNKNYPLALNDALVKKAKPVMDAAVAAQKAKKYPEAVDLYQKALIIRPKNDDLWFNLASTQVALEDYRNAEKSYEKAYKLNPKGQVGSLFYIAKIEEHFGNGVDALAKYKQYLTKDPTGAHVAAVNERVAVLDKDITATEKIKSQKEIALEKSAEESFNAAVALQKQGQYDQAIEKYNAAISQKPIADYVYGLGTCYQAKKDFSSARINYKKAIAMLPQDKDGAKVKKSYEEAVASCNAEEAEPIVQEAVKKLQEKDYVTAIPMLQKALKLIPNNSGVWTNLGLAQQNTDLFKDARASYQKGFDLDNKGAVGNLYLMGTIDENYSNSVAAMANYQKYLKLAPTGQYATLAQGRVSSLKKDPTKLQKLATTSDRKSAQIAADAYNKAVAFQKEKKYDEAIEQFQIAAKAQPSEPNYPYGIGYLYQAKGDIDNAVTYFNKAISLSKDPKQVEEYKKVLAAAIATKAAPFIDDGNKKYAAHDYQGAITAYEDALKADPSGKGIDTFLGLSYQNVGNFAKARSAFMSGYNKGTKDCLFFVGALDENDGNAAKAISTYQKYMAEAPGGAYKANAQQRVDVLRKDPGAAQKIVTQAQAQASKEAQDAYDAAVKLQQEQKYDEAIASYQKAIGVNPKEPAYYYAMGTAYQAKGDNESALTNYQKAADLNPQEPAYKQAIDGIKSAKAAPLLDSAYKKQTTDLGGGKYDLPGAIADYQAALRLYDDANTHMNLGTAFQANNQNQEALAEYSKAITMDAKLADAYYYRGTIFEFLNNKVAARKDYQKYLQLQPSGPNAADVKTRLQSLKPAKKAPRKRRRRGR